MQNRIIILALAILGFNGCVLNKFAGAFQHHPKELEKNLSKESRDLIDATLVNIQKNNLFDYHAHVAGLGSDSSGIYINPRLKSWAYPRERIRILAYLSAAGIEENNHSDINYIKRLIDLVKYNPTSPKLLLLPFDYYHNNDGTINLEKTEFSVPNHYVYSLADQNPHYFEAAMSVHPYRIDALKELEKWAKKGVRVVKWLPNSMNIDPTDPRCDKYYKKMVELNLVLLTHTGKELAVGPEQIDDYGNPLLLRKALDYGVKVIAAHCASLGENNDLDNPGIKEKSFKLFMRLMDDPKYEKLLFGDISGITQVNRVGEPLLNILERPDIHNRLVNGSDYPLPAINILIQTSKLARQGYITREEKKKLNEIYNYNPLLFDFVLKRVIKHPRTKQKLSAFIFERNHMIY